MDHGVLMWSYWSITSDTYIASDGYTTPSGVSQTLVNKPCCYACMLAYGTLPSWKLQLANVMWQRRAEWRRDNCHRAGRDHYNQDTQWSSLRHQRLSLHGAFHAQLTQSYTEDCKNSYEAKWRIRTTTTNVTNIDDLERPWTPKIWVLSEFFAILVCDARIEWIFAKLYWR